MTFFSLVGVLITLAVMYSGIKFLVKNVTIKSDDD